MTAPNLSIIIERGRVILRSALNRVITETALPAYLVEGILLDLLADVRAQKANEITVELEKALAANQKLEQKIAAGEQKEPPAEPEPSKE